MLQHDAKLSTKEWRLINFRTIQDLITAEFLHDLYNRHRPEVNSVRFRNTLCILRGKDFRSYAPRCEWETLANQLGRRFYQREPELLDEIDRYIKKEKRRLLVCLENIPHDLSPLSSEELYDHLSKLHYLALGEIYGINLVQIEHALNWAISKHLAGNGKDFSQLPDFQWASQLKEFEKALMEASLWITEEKQSFDEVYFGFIQRYGHFTSGYGSGIDISEKIRKQLEEFVHVSAVDRKRILTSKIDKPHITASLEFEDLYCIASRIAELRDKNKFLMGKISFARDSLLFAICQQMEISRSDLSRYTLLEIYDLVFHRIRLSSKDIEERHRLVIFKREESFYTNTPAEGLIRQFFSQSQSANHQNENKIHGTIASRGIVRGRARLVLSHKDCDRIEKGDILFALGTDFDLLHGIAICSGIVTEEGGILSHASVVSRELKKPCLIGVSNIMRRVKDGDTVLLNCDEGYVQIQKTTEHDLPGIHFLHESSTGFPSKIANLSQLARGGFAVLPGICIPSSLNVLRENEEFFKRLSAHLNLHLQTSTVIIRGCSPHEDQQDLSYAGLSCSRVIALEHDQLREAFFEVREKKVGMNGYGTQRELEVSSLLIQPFVHFRMGGVTFTGQNEESQEILVEMSALGPFGVVNGVVDRRKRYSKKEIDTLFESPEDTIGFYMLQSAQLAVKISQFFGYDVDIEWGVYKDEIWVLQARPVTIACVS